MQYGCGGRTRLGVQHGCRGGNRLGVQYEYWCETRLGVQHGYGGVKPGWLCSPPGRQADPFAYLTFPAQFSLHGYGKSCYNIAPGSSRGEEAYGHYTRRGGAAAKAGVTYRRKAFCNTAFLHRQRGRQGLSSPHVF